VVRFALLPHLKPIVLPEGDGLFSVALLALEYLNADPITGNYLKLEDGSYPPVGWRVGYVMLSLSELRQLSALPEDCSYQSLYGYDWVMCARRTPHEADICIKNIKLPAWKRHPEVAKKVEEATQRLAQNGGAKLLEALGSHAALGDWGCSRHGPSRSLERRQEPRRTRMQSITSKGNEPFNRQEGKHKETAAIRVVRNNDNDSLLPSGDGRVVIGYVDEVNGAGAAEAASYVPTRHEVAELVKYWYRRVLDNSWFFFICGGTGSSEWRARAFAGRRFDRAEAAIGRESVDAAIKEVHEEFRAKVVKDDRLWDIFEHGTEEQWEEVQADTHREWREQDAAEALERLEQLEKESPGYFIALVLHDWPDDNGSPVLISPADSELNAVLQASGKFQVETDKSRLRTLMVDQHLTGMGFLRAARVEGGWQFEFPCSKPGTIGWSFLESVTAQIKMLLQAGKESQPA
jgi:hypothetical protein